MDPFVTVVVPVRNEERCIAATLHSLLAQNYSTDRFEVIVVDGRSDDGTVPIVEQMQIEFPNLRLLDNPRRLSSAARNLGVQHARGDYVLVVDGHCQLDSPYYLRRLVEVFERHGV